MAANKTNTVKLGMFVMAGLGFLILLLYIIGKNQNLFGSTFLLKARFGNVHGLLAGNNVRFAGIDAGSVKRVEVLNDTTIEVSLLVKTKMKQFIHRNAQISIGTDGLIGNRVINIEPCKTPAPLVAEGDVFWGEKGADTEEMLRVLNNTNTDIATIAGEIKRSINRLNNSKALWGILEDETLPVNIRQSLSHVKSATASMDRSMQDLSVIMEDVKRGKGSIGKLVRDTAMAVAVTDAVGKIKSIGVAADSLSGQISSFVGSISREVNEGKGSVHALLKDEEMTKRLANTLQNIEQDTRSFNEVMEAIKHSFLFRGYFRKMEKQQKQKAATGNY
jgi:phospholipid/cholesterol/gamma-HCH transport system substrate-binding protein